jgi:hypothetical protein
MNKTLSVSITVDDLRAHGFTTAQIERLESLRASYDPYREYFECNREFERLAFLKWRYQRGWPAGETV